MSGIRWEENNEPQGIVALAIAAGMIVASLGVIAIPQAATPHGESVEGRDVVEADALWNELHRLAYRQRCVMVLRYYEDLSEHQTAEVLNCSVGAVKALTKRAMEQLRANVGSEARS